MAGRMMLHRQQAVRLAGGQAPVQGAWWSQDCHKAALQLDSGEQGRGR